MKTCAHSFEEKSIPDHWQSLSSFSVHNIQIYPPCSFSLFLFALLFFSLSLSLSPSLSLSQHTSSFFLLFVQDVSLSLTVHPLFSFFVVRPSSLFSSFSFFVVPPSHLLSTLPPTFYFLSTFTDFFSILFPFVLLTHGTIQSNWLPCMFISIFNSCHFDTTLSFPITIISAVTFCRQWPSTESLLSKTNSFFLYLPSLLPISAHFQPLPTVKCFPLWTATLKKILDLKKKLLDF